MCLCVCESNRKRDIDMELGLSLGESSRSFGGFSDKNNNNNNKMLMMNHNPNTNTNTNTNTNKGLGFCMSLRLGANEEDDHEDDDDDDDHGQNNNTGKGGGDGIIERRKTSLDLQQLDLLPLTPVVARNHQQQQQPQFGLFPWSSENGNSDAGSSGQMGVSANRGFDVNLLPSTEEIDDGAAISSPNSTVSSFQIDFSVYRGGGGSGGGNGSKRDSETAGLNEIDTERTSSRASDDEDNGLARKKLRLSKEQSAFLEESFKEHNTLNPKQKLALAKQLNLRPRQVEVWFQNRRARTKLKQTEVDCEYLKRCCETLTEENRRLQKELQELRALKTSHPYYMQLPATTLTMCPSCERVATTATNPSSAITPTTTTDRNPNHTTTTNNNNNTVVTVATTTTTKSSPFSLNKQRFYPFAHAHQSQHAA